MNPQTQELVRLPEDLRESLQGLETAAQLAEVDRVLPGFQPVPPELDEEASRVLRDRVSAKMDRRFRTALRDHQGRGAAGPPRRGTRRKV